MYNLDYRPKTFAEFVGYNPQIKSLIEKFPDWPSTFLFIGPAGSGKTTLARIIANQLQCKEFNIYEIDAGQDRGIDKIREFIKQSYARPLVGKNKVFIFDEAHGLTNDAQNALLKVTEEAPPNTYFIFCSTDPRKIIKPLRERCSVGEIVMQPLSMTELALIIKKIIQEEKITVDDNLRAIVKVCLKASDGIPRKAVMLFEKYHSYSSVEEVEKELNLTYGEIIDEDLLPMMKALDAKDIHLFVQLFSEYSKGNWESFRIIMGQVYKKRVVNALLRKSHNEILWYNKVLTLFSKPVDNQLGDIELVNRFGSLYE